MSTGAHPCRGWSMAFMTQTRLSSELAPPTLCSYTEMTSSFPSIIIVLPSSDGEQRGSGRVAREHFCWPSGWDIFEGLWPMWIIKWQLVFSSDYLNKDCPLQTWETQLPVRDEQSWEGPAACRLHDEAGAPLICDHMEESQASFTALISCFIERMCSRKISFIANLHKLDVNFLFISVINVDIINPIEEVLIDYIST